MFMKLLPLILIIIGFLALMYPVTFYAAKLGQKIVSYFGE